MTTALTTWAGVETTGLIASITDAQNHTTSYQ